MFGRGAAPAGFVGAAKQGGSIARPVVNKRGIPMPGARGFLASAGVPSGGRKRKG